MTSLPPAADDALAAQTRHAKAELEAQLHSLPAFRALLRGIEAALVAAVVPLPEPVLDLGSGDGDFGARALRAGAVFGLDSDLPSLAEARARHPGRGVLLGSATALPLPDSAIGSVVANSVLEHIPDLEAALAECARVVRPGGRLVVTAPCHRFTGLLGIRRLLWSCGLRWLAIRYGDWFNRRSRHFHLLSASEWERRLDRHGFRVEHQRSYFSPRAQVAFELLHYLGSPTLALRRLTGRWLPWRNPVTQRLAVRWLAPLASAEPIPDGACLFLIAERMA